MSLLWNNNTEERRRRPPSTEEEAAGLGRRTRRRRRLGNPNHNQTGKQSVVITAAAGVASRRHRHSLRRWARNPRGYSLEARRASFHTVQRVWEQSHTGRSIPHDDMTHGASSRNTRTGAVTDTPSPLPPPSAFFHTTNAHAKITTPTTTTTIVHQKRAALRGRQRGLQESNERSDTNHIHHRPTTSIPLVHRSRDEDEDSPYSQSPRLGGANQLIYRQNRRLRVHTAAKNNKQNNTTNTTTTEVWMCGVCGMAFADRSMADGHERRHLATVVAGLLGVNAVYDDTSKSQIATRIPSSSPLPAWMPPNDNNNNNPNGRIPLAAAKAQQQQFVPEKVRFAAASNGNDENDSNDVNSILLLDEAFPPEPRNRHKDYTNNISDTDDNDSVFQFLDHEPPSAFSNNKNNDGEDALLLSRDMKEQVVLADEALVDVVSRAVPMILTAAERDAELELALLARDKAYYDELSRRAMARQVNPSNRFRSDGEDVLAKVQNKFLDAYQIMKESDGKKGITDQYNRQGKSGPGGEAAQSILVHSDRTLYINVMVKNSVQVVRYELERLAKQRWEMVNNDAMGDESNGNHNNNAHNNTNRKAHPRLPHIVKDHADKTTPAAATVGPPLLLTRFERFRVYTQINVVKLAGIALASDFTPRRIAVQLSNDLYRLVTPRLKRRGVSIETEIEYRVGPYFVLAVNIQSIDWRKLIRATHREVAQRTAKWQKENPSKSDASNKRFFRRILPLLRVILNLTLFDFIERTLVLMYHFHPIVYLPICWAAYYSFLGAEIRTFVLAGAADEIFYYVEEKGMDMSIRVCSAESQAAFMLTALREIRADGNELKKKRKQSGVSGDDADIICPLLGPAIAADKGPPPQPPEDFVIPENLEFIGLELELPVGFQRMRWAFLSKRSEFITEGLCKKEAKYENIVMGNWNKHTDHIGEPKLPEGVNESDFVGAEKEGEYLMPKSAFVSANMCYETHYLLAYNDYCFCLKKQAKNPDVPFGKTFIAWTQYLVVNTGNGTCKLTCSVEPEFPNGEPMVSRQIKSAMRAGTGELFVLIGETVAKYSTKYP